MIALRQNTSTLMKWMTMISKLKRTGCNASALFSYENVASLLEKSSYIWYNRICITYRRLYLLSEKFMAIILFVNR